MAIIEPVKKNLEHPQQIKRYSFSLRLWHWLNAIVITGSLLTVLINSTLLDRKTNAPFIKETLQKSGAVVTDDQANSVSHDLGDQVWAIHTYFGYALAALLLFRIILEFFQVADQKLMGIIKHAYHQYNTTKKNRELARHEMVVKTLYAIFYLLLVIMATTGLFLAFEDFFAPYKSIRHSVKEVHGFTMYLIIGFIVIHILGVLLAERKDSKGIISDMINGGGE
ncbi:cytochrome b/b6 domain-containing protein [Mucilaginibacter sp. UR6-11]|uniref:cytochrome b/b6 domain-containing protein n=1 Tax=Mucilaginibacter sp. UR6-11 TaxID=1435644 RepID=UPI001E5B38D7|nr:cytochrome b/b6 domain-containing protein [Mucilaginibacter sp. UR6-11]MCC8425626.1 cytochrome b/b6 domain-containing protein [Mucilaginibacter sp. UR6-11]